MIIENKNGQVYGTTVAPTESFTIPSDTTLTIPAGTTLNIESGKTLTHNGSIIGYGTLDGDGDLEGSGTIADTIKNNLRKESAVEVSVSPSSAAYGSTITITATISRDTNTRTRMAEQNKVNFYLGTVDSGILLGTADVNNHIATLPVSLTDRQWKPGLAYEISAEYGGSMGLKSQTGATELVVERAKQTGKPTVFVSETTADSIMVSASGSGQGGYEYACVEGENAIAPYRGWQDGNTFSDRKPGTAYTVFARYAGDEYYEPSSASDGVTAYTAAKKPAASDVTIVYTEETISFDDSLEVNTMENFNGTSILSGGSITNYIGSILYVRVKRDGNIPVSEALPLTLALRPAAPGVPLNYEAETLSTTPAMQYGFATSGQSVQEWKICGENMKAAAFGWDGLAEVTVTFRTAATSSDFASVETAVTIPARPEAPAAPVVADRTSSSIEVTAVSGQEYKLGEGQWQASSGDAIIFDNLEAGQSYTIYTRTKAGADSFASRAVSAVTSTKEGAAAAPSVGDPAVTAGTVTLPQNSAWEYSLDGNDWSDTCHFTGLEAATKYTYYVRVKETENAEASQAAVVTVYTAKEVPNKGTGYEVIYEAETLTVNNGYEVNTALDFTGTMIHSGSSIEPGGTYYVRAAASNDDDGLTIPCSEAVGFTLDNRPAAPNTLQEENETFEGEKDGKITGTSSAMEYRLSSVADWEPCAEESVTGLAPGTYYVRFKATDSAFASLEAAVEIKIGEQRTYTLNVAAPLFDSVAYGYTQPEAGAITINSAGNSDAAISSVTVDSENFVISGFGSAVTAGGSLDTWTIRPVPGLKAGAYTAAITVNYTGDGKATAQVSFTVNQAEQAAPDEGLELESRDRSSITLTAVPDNENGAKAEYSRDGGASWQINPVFTGLSSGTTYSFIVRYGATADGNYKASPASPAAEYSTEKSGGGGGGGSSYTEYTITATAGAGGSISPSYSVGVREGRDKTFTITPDGGYYIFDVLVDGQSVGVVSSYTFENVEVQHTIEAVFAKGNSETSDAAFESNTVITRAQIAVLLYHIDGSPEVTGDSPFTDVACGPGTEWYYDAVLWASQKGIAAGYGDNTYHPEDPVTCEQLAVMFYNYAGYKGYDLTATRDLSGFTDAGSVSNWAVDAVKWAVGSGLMKSCENGALNPQKTATRAEAWAMLHNFIERNYLVPPAGKAWDEKFQSSFLGKSS
ncbi:MAG: S-layer homology domain-containing protein [Lachnoclostridium edouardi]|uniref:S-layer homology domain-containing protein n=1 Tax=Lachnoclostridium edouardi TaxID=1926283 RepID=UPI0026DD19DC|nr:S-layer homology domain-containing protein [Lachnoclostridium edouardi]MDO4279207.1 S-layer homology domain-containing protein [Lachnoclostridium edouardi]